MHFYQTSCSPDDFKPNCTTVCLNGGIVNTNCDCDCPQGYTGSMCQDKKDIFLVTILKIEVTKFPAQKSNGTNWDSGSGAATRPDLVSGFATTDAQTFFVDTSANPFNDAINNNPYFWISNGNWFIQSFDAKKELVVFLADKDLNEVYEMMGGITFKFSDFQGFPTEIELQNVSNPVAFKVTVKYDFL